MDPAKIACIVLCYNGIDLTLQCLDSLQAQDYLPIQIIVVDNASQDDTVAVIQSTYPDIKLIANEKNLGYTAGNNVGIKAALADGAEYIFIVNNDTTLEKDCLSKLVEALQRNPQAGIAGPMVYTFDPGQVISSAGGMVDWVKADAINIGAGEQDEHQYPEREVDFINGCGLMIRKEVVQRVGVLDERYFMYWEETDWCTRAKRANWRVIFAPSAQMRHKAPINPQQLNPVTIYYMTRNRLRFFGLHTPWPRKSLTLAYALNGVFQGIATARKNGQTRLYKAMQAALVDAILRRWGAVSAENWK